MSCQSRAENINQQLGFYNLFRLTRKLLQENDSACGRCPNRNAKTAVHGAGDKGEMILKIAQRLNDFSRVFQALVSTQV